MKAVLELIMGRAGAGKTRRVMESIGASVAACRGGNILIVPEQYSHEAERELCAVCGDSLSLYAEVLSFTRLASRAEDEYGGSGKSSLDKGGKLLCMALALDAVGGKLTAYGAARRRPEMQKRLLDAAEELKSACVTPEMLESAADRSPRALGDKLRDLALTAGAYEAAAERSGADPMDSLDRLALAVREHSLGAGKRIYADGFTDFTGQELEVLRAYLDTGAELTVCLTCDTELDSEVFEPSIKTAFLLRRIAEEAGVEARETFMSAEPGEKDPALSFLEKNMFGFGVESFQGENSSVRLFRADNVFDECELAASLCVRLAREKGVRWREIAVAVRGYEQYRPALESAFERYGVPLYSTRKGNILQKPLMALIVYAFETIQGGWSYDDVFTYLKTGLCGLTAEECDTLSGYVYLWNLRGSAWTKAEDWTLHPNGYGEKYTDETRERLREINSLRERAARPLINLQERGKTAETAREQLEALCAFFEEISLAERLEQRARELEGLGRSALAAEYSQLWDILVGAVEQCASVLGDMSLTQEEFSRLLCIVLSQYDVGTIPVSLDSVTAGDMDRMRRRHIKHLIVLGASDENLPAQTEDTGLFSDDERETLLGLGVDLGSPGADIYREFMLIYNCLTLPSESLTMTFPARTADGAESGPSFVFKSISKMFGLSPVRVDTDRARMNALVPALELAASGRGERRAAAEAWFDGDPARRERLEKLKKAAGLTRGALSDESVRALYGKRIHMTASRAEVFSSCKFEFFMQYGLRAKPRQPAGFDPPQMGTFMHFVLQRVCAEIKDLGGFRAVSREQVAGLAEKYVDEYVSNELNDFAGRSPRFIYLFNRLRDTVRTVVLDMAEELRLSDFEPLDFELRFSDGGDGSLPPIEIGEGESGMELVGVADRVDGWLHDGKLYLRVVDYKTGKKSFSLSDVCRGMGLQMLLYLFALGREGADYYGYEIVPAGVLYSPARDLKISADSRPDDETLEKKRRAGLRRSGLILDESEVIAAMERSESPAYIPIKFNRDGKAVGDALVSAERLGTLSKFIEKTLRELAKNLRSGSIAADPYFRSVQDNACLYCDYAGSCGFGEYGGEQQRLLVKYKNEEAWDHIEKEAEENGRDQAD